ncbi:hypothetical protein CNQ82_11805 [Staphylococcus debuckii]|nr:hypothetical protein CNQ82_11805 [Staphylococcus debuckii]
MSQFLCLFVCFGESVGARRLSLDSLWPKSRGSPSSPRQFSIKLFLVQITNLNLQKQLKRGASPQLLFPNWQ